MGQKVVQRLKTLASHNSEINSGLYVEFFFSESEIDIAKHLT